MDRGSHSAPLFVLASDRILRTRRFQARTPPSTGVVVITVGSEWMREHGVSCENVWTAGYNAKLFLASGGPQAGEVPPCAKCKLGQRPNVHVGTVLATRNQCDHDNEALELRQFVFDSCFSRCNSSRLHLGGQVVLVSEIVSDDGGVVATVRTEPFHLGSRAAAQTRIKKEPPSHDTSPAPAPSVSAATANGQLSPEPPVPDAWPQEEKVNESPLVASSGLPAPVASVTPLVDDACCTFMTQLKDLERQCLARLVMIDWVLKQLV
eukprot:m51a1_g2985 hypothetical protein (265) ;mRNA; f:733593-734621